MCGGFGNVKPADADVQAKVDAVLAAVNTQLGSSHAALEVVHYKTQVVAGTNYLVKVKAGDSHLHLKIYQPLPHTGQGPSLSEVNANKTAECAL